MMLELDCINTFYGPSHILYDVSLKVNESEIIALLGRNGVGKTTTLKSIIGIVKPRTGHIWFFGQDLMKLQSYEIARRQITLIPEERRIFAGLKVIENIEMGLCNQKRISPDFRKRRIEEIFSLFPKLEERRNQMGGTLSGGEQQMLAIARGLMSNARLILMDEPSEGLAPLIVYEIFAVIQKIAKKKNSILLVEQNARLALKIASRGYIMEKGRIIIEGSNQKLADSEEAKAKLVV